VDEEPTLDCDFAFKRDLLDARSADPFLDFLEGDSGGDVGFSKNLLRFVGDNSMLLVWELIISTSSSRTMSMSTADSCLIDRDDDDDDFVIRFEIDMDAEEADFFNAAFEAMLPEAFVVRLAWERCGDGFRDEELFGDETDKGLAGLLKSLVCLADLPAAVCNVSMSFLYVNGTSAGGGVPFSIQQEYHVKT
jgi:hypothetical protein